jgi:hypothetical protein
MMKFSFRRPILGLSSVLVRAMLGMLVLCGSAHATSQFRVTVNTSSLMGANPNAPFALDFQFNNGSILNNNTLTVDNFLFNGGGPVGVPTLLGGVTGNIGSSIFFNNSSPFQELFQTFTPGTSLRFDVLFTANSDGVTPDAFAFAILDKDLLNIPTSGLGDSLFLVNVDSPGPTPQTASGIGAFSNVTTSTAPVPEPAPCVLILTGLPLLGIVARRRMSWPK